jgi:ubiquinone/menaquinone biosynthesis C-methylase UbiE
MTQTTTATGAAGARDAFHASADSYDRFMGRYLPSLAPVFADAAGVDAGTRLLDVGCGPGGLTVELARRAGARHVAAIDPSPPFAQACRERNPGVDVREGFAEHLPYSDDEFDVSLASLVVGFMSDPHRGLAEMARVTRPGGTVAVCFWDLNRMPTLRTFWAAARAVQPKLTGEMRRIGGSRGELAALLDDAGLRDVREAELAAEADYSDFEDFWSPIELNVGPIGSYYQSLSSTDRAAVRQECLQLLGRRPGPFSLRATCWFAAGVVPYRVG